ncbi:glycosyl transferase [Slackia faecicanis]|uniref:Glycosyl transferase n=1 Tax=Slackia faecicanis TaxID=255723 RepID=A0A3N0AH37_9ACTN|nr:glycosyltransferase family 2 protein [Slackia faecicanis]RNL21429.1 glycosyl transferase [Slackia faecicanis]
MANKPGISVIIPVYKVQDWVGRAIESIQAQTFGNFELLLVDDGSPDESGAICDSYAARDERITVIHKPNGGAASARNAAMAQAKGEYLFFMDADDWCEPEMLERMYERAESGPYDLVVAGFYIDTYRSDDKFFRETKSLPSKTYASVREFREDAYRLFDRNLLYTPWNKLFRASYLFERDIEFPDVWWDDLPFNLAVLRDVERVALMEDAFYHFLRARSESENTKYRAGTFEKREEEDGWMRELYEHWGVSDEASREFLARRHVERVVGCIETVTCADCPLSPQEKKAEVARMVLAPSVRRAVAEARPGSLMMRAMLLPIRWRKPGLMTAESRFISWVKRNFVGVFAYLKAHR